MIHLAYLGAFGFSQYLQDGPAHSMSPLTGPAEFTSTNHGQTQSHNNAMDMFDGSNRVSPVSKENRDCLVTHELRGNRCRKPK